MCDAVCLINHGTKVLDGALYEIKQRFKHNSALLGYSGNDSFLGNELFKQVNKHPHHIEIALDDLIDAQEVLRQALSAGAVINRFQIVEPTLNDIFIETVREKNGKDKIDSGIFMLTFLAITGYGSQVMFGVIEEKSTRIIEVMVSSAKPFEMMMGKLIGIGLVGLTQYAIWVIATLPIFFISQSVLATKGIALNSIPISSLLSFIVYFVLGYFLFAAIYVVGGALVTDSEDGNVVTRFMMVLTTIPLITVMAVAQNPNGAIALTLSFIPFFTAGTMVLRMAMASPPLWQILLSMALMVATIGAVIWVAAKIYRVGILIHGKKPSLGEIIRWLRYT